MQHKEQKILDKKESAVIEKWEYFLISILGIVFCGFAVALFSMSKNASSDLLLSKRTLKKTLEYSSRYKDSGLGGAYKPDSTTAPVTYFDYYIKSGESIHSIARRFGMDEVTLVNINDISCASVVRAGLKIQIPNQDGILVNIKDKKELEEVAQKYNFEKEELCKINNLSNDNPEAMKLFVPGVKFDSLTRSMLLGEYFRRPAYGRFTSMYGYRKDPWTGVSNFHHGVDIANRNGGNIYSAAAGTVIYCGWSWVYGNMIRIKHPGGYVTLYGHLDKIQVKDGSWVNSGAVIGKMGNTGRSTGTHLHYEVRQWGKTVNPLRVTIF